jgi:cytochrome b
LPTSQPIPARGPTRVKVWDAPVRVFHWAIVILIAAAWWTAENDQMQWHRLCGYAVAGLLAFRLWWGFAGGSTARFSAFMKGPRAVFAYAASLLRRKTAPEVPGHNPMGGWSVAALLVLMAAVVGSGLFSVDVDGIESGPLAARISFEAGRAAAHWHQVLFNGLLALIALHVAAIAFYAVVRRDNLVGPMVTGSKRGGDEDQGLQSAQFWSFALGLIIAVLVAVVLARA